MTKYESTIKHSYAPNDRVYAKLSDLSNLQVLKDRISDPNFVNMIKAQAGDKVNDEQLEQIKERVQSLEFTPDSVSGHVDQLGVDMTLRIVERDQPKLVKLVLDNSPVPATLWVQMLPATDGGTKMKLTVGVELNFFMRKMIEGKLKDGVEKMADMLAMLPY